jgi:hypothetical protein
MVHFIDSSMVNEGSKKWVESPRSDSKTQRGRHSAQEEGILERHQAQVPRRLQSWRHSACKVVDRCIWLSAFGTRCMHARLFS